MSRTFRNIKIKPSVHKYTYHSGEVGISIYLNGLYYHYRNVDYEHVENRFFELYRDKRRCSYKYYRKYEEQQYKTYCKRFIRRSLMDGEDGVLKPATRTCSGYWD